MLKKIFYEMWLANREFLVTGISVEIVVRSLHCESYKPTFLRLHRFHSELINK